MRGFLAALALVGSLSCVGGLIFRVQVEVFGDPRGDWSGERWFSAVCVVAGLVLATIGYVGTWLLG